MQKAIRDWVPIAWEATGPKTGLTEIKTRGERKIIGPYDRDVRCRKIIVQVIADNVQISLNVALFLWPALMGVMFPARYSQDQRTFEFDGSFYLNWNFSGP